MKSIIKDIASSLNPRPNRGSNTHNNNEYSMTGLSGKVALVTGGSKGIGKATSLALAKAGATVVINYASDANAAEALVKEIGPEQAFAIQADAGSITGCEQIVKKTVEKFKKIDILIPNAGVLPMKTLEQTTEEDFDRTFAINVKGPYFLVQVYIMSTLNAEFSANYPYQKAAPHMQSGSHIVLISTTLCAASTVTPNYLLYCSTKGAIEQMTKILSKDLATKGIAVNAIAPGPTATDLFLKGKSEQVLKTIAGFNPYNRIGTPEEIADAVVFLSSPESRWIAGQIVRVNGGMA